MGDNDRDRSERSGSYDPPQQCDRKPCVAQQCLCHRCAKQKCVDRMRIVLLGTALLLSVARVAGISYILLKNKAPKCYHVEVASNTRLIIQYHAPGKLGIYVTESFCRCPLPYSPLLHSPL
jgi:hypothetical protein